MERLAAAAPPGAGGVLFTPWLNGERTPVDDHLVRGGFFNLSLGTSTEQLARAVFEGVALNARWMARYVDRFVKRRLEPLAFIGGGARSDLWCQIMADVLGREIRQVEQPVLAGVRGAALLAGLALGDIDRDELHGRAQVKAVYRPDPATTTTYDELAKAFVSIYKANKGLYARLNKRRGGSTGTGDPMSDPLSELEHSLKPYRDQVETYERLPEQGRDRAEVLAEVQELARAERPRWEDGYASGAVYNGDREHIDFLAEVYAAHSQSNPLHVDLWPSATKFEAEIVSMTRSMLNGADDVVGTVSSGGTESILLAMKAYRDHSGKATIVAPETAHAAFDKAEQLLGVKLVKVPVGDDLRADVAAMADADRRRHRRRGRLGARLPARPDRPDRAALGAGARAWRRLPHRRLPRRLRTARSPSAWATTCRRSTSACPG